MINGDAQSRGTSRAALACFNGAVDRDQRRPRQATRAAANVRIASMEPLIVINGDQGLLGSSD